MEMKNKLKKFFRENNKNIAIDDELIKGWIQNELDFSFSNSDVYNFLSSVAFFGIRRKKAIKLNWDKIEKRFNIKYKGEIVDE